MHNNLPPVRVIATLVPSPRVDPFGDPAGAPPGRGRGPRRSSPGRRAEGRSSAAPLLLGRHNEGLKEEGGRANGGNAATGGSLGHPNGFSPPGSGGAQPPTLPGLCWFCFGLKAVVCLRQCSAKAAGSSRGGLASAGELVVPNVPSWSRMAISIRVATSASWVIAAGARPWPLTTAPVGMATPERIPHGREDLVRRHRSGRPQRPAD